MSANKRMEMYFFKEPEYWGHDISIGPPTLESDELLFVIDAGRMALRIPYEDVVELKDQLKAWCAQRKASHIIDHQCHLKEFLEMSMDWGREIPLNDSINKTLVNDAKRKLNLGDKKQRYDIERLRGDE